MEVGQCFTLAGGGNSQPICIAGLAPVQFVVGDFAGVNWLGPTQSEYPAGSTLSFLEGVDASTNTSMVITCGPIEAGATTINLSPEAEAVLEVGMCFTLAGGGNSEAVCIAGLAPVQLVSPTQFAYPVGSTLTLLPGAFASADDTMVLTCGPIEAGATSIDLSAEMQALMEVGMCFTLSGGGNSEEICIAGLAPVQLVSPTQFAYPAGSTLTLLEGVSAPSNTSVVIPFGPLEAGATSIDLSA